MFLKKMYLKGFKSFAHPVNINFTDGLTVVVGPNGSGKSNINDALRWVLGEASKKNLRASSAKDMIFAGSPDEKPAEYAEVTLFIDNSAKILNTKDKELSITRRSYMERDENEYFINKEQVRRKDIKDLFLDTGLGNVDLSIISQGSITKVVDARPKDLRSVLNEAAGVSRYQKQKEEALNNLKNVDRNLEIISVKYEQLERQIKPLRKQADKAKEYFKIRESLSKIELPILKKNLIQARKQLKTFEGDFNKATELESLLNSGIKTSHQKSINNQNQIISIEKQITKFASKTKALNEAIEKQKLTSASDVDNIVLQIKEKQASINTIRQNINEFETNESNQNQTIYQMRQEINLQERERDRLNSELSRLNYEIEAQNKSLKKDRLDFGTRHIVENSDIFSGYVGLVRDLYEVNDEHRLAVEVALGAQAKNVVMKNETSIKEALSFLKTNKYGTATFIPSEQVKPKSLSMEFENILTKINGYLGTVDEIINYPKKHEKVFKFLGGIILVFTDFDSAIKASKIIDFRFKIVTLEGDTIFPGFVVKGGSNNSKEQFLAAQLEKLKAQFKTTKEALNLVHKNLETNRTNLNEQERKLNGFRHEDARLNERLNYLESQLTSLHHLYKDAVGEDYQEQNGSKEDKKIDKTFTNIAQIEQEVKSLQANKEALAKENITLKVQEEKARNEWNEVVKKVASLKAQINEANNTIKSALLILQRDYKLNEDLLLEKELPGLTMSYADANKRCEKYRKELEKIGYVNVDSIKEFEELDIEFQQLNKDLKDLTQTKEKLLSTVEEMDQRMEAKFSKIFEQINIEFDKAFVHLFGGGTARIKYSDPENILESGIEIFARSPGKNVKNIQLYSGGEKSMIAIALIFAINKIRNLPLLILDEVEAALDEANVERFANFAKEINKLTQVIITSHRPGTMEKADVLYGVTMQQRGITKILSVKLEDAIEMIDEES